MLYSDFVTALGDLLVIPVENPTSQNPSIESTDFNNILPRIIEAAEQRIYRELDFLNTRTEDATAALSTTSRRLTLPAQIIVLQTASFITPAGSTPVNGTRNPLRIVSKSMLDFMWPSELTSPGPPQYLAQLSDTVVMVAPTADQSYTLECTGIFRPAPLAYNNTSTYLTLKYPDLFLYAAMVFAAGHQRDYGAQSDDPKMAMSWEVQYQTAKKSAFEEDQRRKSQSTNWSPLSQTPLSSPRK